ncbi:MAG: hypothetical protein OHK0039_17170 [Bacteroidia bacterium]
MYKIILSALALVVLTGCPGTRQPAPQVLPDLVRAKSQALQTHDGRTYRDLNHNGTQDPYEDSGQPAETRVADLLSQMTLEEKAGMMFISGAPVSADGKPDGSEGLTGPAARMPSVVENMSTRKMNHFNIWSIPDDPQMFATWYNQVQLLAEQSRLGIPVTIASDPRHHFSRNIFSVTATGFTQFCETLGLAAIGDEALVRTFADIVRQEYLATGIREALHPQIDLATEPRWPRINGGFGEDAQLTARMVRAYIEGMQGPTLGSNSVACMTKHFPGGGPQKEGLDPHFDFQQGQIYPGDSFDYHLIPFEAAFEAGTAAIMPYYGIPVGQTDEEVGMAYNKTIITTLLREKYKFDGIVWKARAWGVEHLNEADRVLKIIEAGCDQFGGEIRPELVVQLVQEGRLSEARIDESIRRLLRQRFELGLFDNPFVDETQTAAIVGKAKFRALGERTQQEAMTLLKNDAVLPLAPGK